MTIFAVTESNWNDDSFWSSVDESSEGHTLDFSALSSDYSITFDHEDWVLYLSDGTTTYSVGDASAWRVWDAYLGGSTDFSYFTMIVGSQGDDSISGGDTDDTLDGQAGDDSLIGGAGDDSLTGGDGADTIRGGEGADTIEGGEGDDSIYGNEGGDTIIGGAGNDSVYGEYGDDYVEGGDGDDHLEGNEGDDTLYGGAGDDWMRGSYDNDELWGGEGDDYLWGGWGDDTFHIENNFGNDTVDAEGVEEVNGDTLDLSAVTDAITIDLGDINPEVGTVTDGASTLEFDEVENIVLSAGVDTLELHDGGGLDTVIGFEAPTYEDDGSYTGNDLLDVSDLTDADGNPVDTADVTVSDTNGDGTGDAVLTFPNGETLTLTGVSVADVSSEAQLAAMGIPLAGSDGGDDTAVGGGDDTIVDGGDDTVVGGGDDTIVGDGGDDTSVGDGGDDTSEGGSGSDTLEVPEIDGAFEFEATITFDDVAAGGSQRVFEFGTDSDNQITFGQLGPSTAVVFTLVQGGETYYIVAEDAIVEGESATWTVGIDESGLMYVDKDGVQVAEGDGVVPTDIDRGESLLGSSSDPDINSLQGEMSDISITQGSTVWTDTEGTIDGGDDTAVGDGGDDTIVGDGGDDTVVGGGDDTSVGDSGSDTLDVPEIDGAFEFEATITFDDVAAGGSQRVFEFGTDSDNQITFGQLGPSTAVVFTLVQGGETYYIVAEDAIVEGESATWTVGIDESGLMYVDKDGVQVAEGDGVVPTDIDRGESLLGSSSDPDINSLQGEMSDISITQGSTIWTDTEGTIDGGDDTAVGDGGDDTIVGDGGDDTSVGDGGDDTSEGGSGSDTLDVPEIDGAFEFEATITFDDVAAGGSQRVFEFGTDSDNQITFGQLGPSTAVVFTLVQGGETYYIVAEDAIVEGESATWTVGIDESGLMYVDKDGVQVAEGDGVVPTDIDRGESLLGSSSDPDINSLQGEMSDISITQGDTVWTDTDGSVDGGDDSSVGDGGDDTIAGDGGEDTTVGDGGDDTTSGDGGDDTVESSGGEDTVDADAGSDTTGEDDLPQIDGAFEFNASVAFSNISSVSSQRVFEFGTSSEDQISFGQLGPSNAVVFSILQSGVTHYIVAEDAIVEGETAHWTVGVDSSGLMYVDKDGTQVAEGDGVVPSDTDRTVNLIGSSSNPGINPLQGQISYASIVQDSGVWTDGTEESSDGSSSDTTTLAAADDSISTEEALANIMSLFQDQDSTDKLGLNEDDEDTLEGHTGFDFFDTGMS